MYEAVRVQSKDGVGTDGQIRKECKMLSLQDKMLDWYLASQVQKLGRNIVGSIIPELSGEARA